MNESIGTDPRQKNESSVENIFSYSMVCQRNVAAVDGPEGSQRSVIENKTKHASRFATTQ